MLSKFWRVSLLLLIITSCNSSPEIPGLDLDKWNSSEVCSDYRIEGAEIIEANEEVLLSLTQAEIEGLFGVVPRHQLWNRNEKFFYYPVTKDCSEGVEDTNLFIRFDALGRAKEVLVLIDDSIANQ